MHPALRAWLGPLRGTQHLFSREESLREQSRSASGVAGCSLSGTSTGCQVHKQINTLCVVSTVEKDSLSQDRLSHFLVGNRIFLFLSLLLLKHTRDSRGRQRIESCYIPCQEGPKMKHTMSLPELLKKADVLETNRRPWCRLGRGGLGVACVSQLTGRPRQEGLQGPPRLMSHVLSQKEPQTTRKSADRLTAMFSVGRVVQREPVDTDSPMSPQIPGHGKERLTWVTHQATKVQGEKYIQLSSGSRCSCPVCVSMHSKILALTVHFWSLCLFLRFI